MKLDRGELQAVVKAASTVMMGDHKVALFTKVWFMRDCVMAFNNAGAVIHLPMEGIAELGGIDGTLLAQLLDRSDVEDVELDTEGEHVRVKLGRSVTTLPVLEPTEYVKNLVTPPDMGKVWFEMAVPELFEDVEIEAMLKVKKNKAEQALAFSCITFEIDQKTGRVALFTSDRVTISRTLLKLVAAGQRFQIPLEFMRAVKKCWGVFGEGTVTFDEERMWVVGANDELLYTTYAPVNMIIDFVGEVNRMWPQQKIDTKLLVPIPERFYDAIRRAKTIAKADDAALILTVENKVLTVQTDDKVYAFKESMKFDHPDVQLCMNCKMIADSLPYVDRMYVGPSNMAVFGPKRFSRFLAGIARHGHEPEA